MGNPFVGPCSTGEGVKFTVIVECVDHPCLVSREVLEDLWRSQEPEHDLLDTYRAHEAQINGVARRMVAAGVSGSPIILGTKNFH